ncbi:hypothetical protein FA09DRAFT_29915 [Tilletiopsis washingtonensis]|uniref:Uncharacterized protein n=1 Tax=Tilletiopsis washingtonensis TaxID=58919 RepID=A0A316ZA89_9BASI|nr:hypothetical protein FA09DRAFT_29915 [Tilletiopsis washingtonensis]PWN97872.1 hypothetical protein FA09DRAFT_29915 [Tilletiopsis washingtonensis]
MRSCAGGRRAEDGVAAVPRAALRLCASQQPSPADGLGSSLSPFPLPAAGLRCRLCMLVEGSGHGPRPECETRDKARYFAAVTLRRKGTRSRLFGSRWRLHPSRRLCTSDAGRSPAADDDPLSAVQDAGLGATAEVQQHPGAASAAEAAACSMSDGRASGRRDSGAGRETPRAPWCWCWC